MAANPGNSTVYDVRHIDLRGKRATDTAIRCGTADTDPDAGCRPAATPAYAADSPVVDLGLAPGQRVNKTVVITPTLAEGADVKRIVLYVNDIAVTGDNTAPWSLTWNTTTG
jgi:hypothetical protein